MRLERVELENYRAVRRLVIGLDSVTTIIGEHHCGKSSLLAAIATLLDPTGPDRPSFTTSDFHRSLDSERADHLSVTIGFRRPHADERERGRDDDAEQAVANVLTRERFSIRVEARRTSESETPGRITVLDADGEEIPLEDPGSVLRGLRRRAPALVIRWRSDENQTDANPTDPVQASRQRITNVFRHLNEPWIVAGEIGSVMADVHQFARSLADSLTPAPERPRSIDDLADTPQPLITDFNTAMHEDAGHQRHVALVLFIGAVLEALPPTGLAPDADPILLFDDIETNLHPIWLAAVFALATSLPLQQILTTHSSEVLNWMPLRSLRRLVRTKRGVQARFVNVRALTRDERRRVTYHLRLNRGSALSARCWVLVEGQTEAWLVPEFARLCGVEFAVEGIQCVEFAQCGITPLLKLASALRIGWVLLADGDGAGRGYVNMARERMRPKDKDRHLLMLDAKDIEHYLYAAGYAAVIRKTAGRKATKRPSNDPRRITRTIRDAARHVSKPGLALAILEAANKRGEAGVPPAMRQLAEMARDFARLAQDGGR